MSILVMHGVSIMSGSFFFFVCVQIILYSRKKMKLWLCHFLVSMPFNKLLVVGQSKCRIPLEKNGIQKNSCNVSCETWASILPSFLSHLAIMREAAIFELPCEEAPIVRTQGDKQPKRKRDFRTTAHERLCLAYNHVGELRSNSGPWENPDGTSAPAVLLCEAPWARVAPNHPTHPRIPSML